MSVASTIARKLEEAISPERLEVIDESHRHAGHVGAQPGGETHFRLEIVSAAFTGMSLLERQRLIHGVLAEEIAGPIHALSLALRAPDEAPPLGSAEPGG